MEIKKGKVVISSAGHDSGRWMVVVREDEGYVFIADGKERKLEAPKKKNIKHIRVTSKYLELEGMTNKKLRQALCTLAGGNTLQESE